MVTTFLTGQRCTDKTSTDEDNYKNISVLREWLKIWLSLTILSVQVGPYEGQIVIKSYLNGRLWNADLKA
jgi:hypothetical protein